LLCGSVLLKAIQNHSEALQTVLGTTQSIIEPPEDFWRPFSTTQNHRRCLNTISYKPPVGISPDLQLTSVAVEDKDELITD